MLRGTSSQLGRLWAGVSHPGVGLPRSWTAGRARVQGPPGDLGPPPAQHCEVVGVCPHTWMSLGLERSTGQRRCERAGTCPGDEATQGVRQRSLPCVEWMGWKTEVILRSQRGAADQVGSHQRQATRFLRLPESRTRTFSRGREQDGTQLPNLSL